MMRSLLNSAFNYWAVQLGASEALMSDHALHADQDRFENLTNNQVRRLMRTRDFAVIAIDHAIRRLEPMLTPQPGTGRAERWNRENYHCWWGEYDHGRSHNTAKKCVKRFRLAKAKLLDDEKRRSQIRYKLRPNGKNTVAPYLGWRIYLDATFFSSTSLERLTTLIHETFHLLGMVDLRYFRESSVNLAQTCPLLARGNPDNYAYYAVDCYRNYLTWLRLDDPSTQLARQVPGPNELLPDY